MALFFYLQASFSEHFYGLQRVWPGRSPRLVFQLAAALVPQFKRDNMAFVPKRLLYTDQIWFFIY